MKKITTLSSESNKHVENSAFQPAPEVQPRRLKPRLAVTKGGSSVNGVIRVDWTVDHVKAVQPADTFTPSELIERRKSQGRSERLAAARVRLATRMGPGAATTLQQARLAAGLSQTDLANYLGSSQPSVARLEAGREKNPSLQTLRGLCKALELDMNAVERFFS